MASQKQVLLVTLLLVVALGCQGCDTNLDCPPCNGDSKCVNGVCQCTVLNSGGDDVAVEDRACNKREDCAALCPKSCPAYTCQRNVCICC